MNGYVLIDKPADWTSFDVVNKVRSLSGIKKVGHAGTLDPFATGLVIVLLGNYTKQQDEFMKKDKTYEVTAKLGIKSTTGDPEGELTEVSSQRPSLEEVTKALQSFVGTIQQTPPAFSAIKVNGQRAYDLARKGRPVELKPRTVTIYSITGVKYTFPELKFTTSVSSGTYIRSLVEDIGTDLGTGAYTTQLRRTLIGDFAIKDAIGMAGLTAELLYEHCRTS